MKGAGAVSLLAMLLAGAPLRAQELDAQFAQEEFQRFKRLRVGDWSLTGNDLKDGDIRGRKTVTKIEGNKITVQTISTSTAFGKVIKETTNDKVFDLSLMNATGLPPGLKVARRSEEVIKIKDKELKCSVIELELTTNEKKTKFTNYYCDEVPFGLVRSAVDGYEMILLVDWGRSP